MPPSKILISVYQYFLITILCTAKETDILIESSLIVNLDSSVENSNRRHSTSYQQFGKENLINDGLNDAYLSPNPDLSSALELVYNTLDENSLFDAFDHTLSYSIDLKNNGSYGDPESSSSILKDNLNIAINSCIKRALDLNIDIRTIAENISSRTIENFIVNAKGVSNWSESTPEWLETLAEIVTTSSLNSFTDQNQETIIPLYAEVFSDSVLDLYNLDPNNPNLKSTNLYPGIEAVSNNPSQANEVMLFGGDTDGFFKFDPLKTQIFASSTAGLIKVAAKQSIVSSNVDPFDIEDFTSTMDAIDSISKSYFNFIEAFDGDNTLFTYELTKSFALGVSTAALKTALENTNLNENVTPEIFLEFASEQIGKTVMLNSLDFPNLSISELAEASAIGNAIGTQFTTISYNQHNLDPKFAGFNRDNYARISSKGMASGTISSISEKIEDFSTKANKNQDSLISEVASHSAKGSVYGNTTLAIYNPTPNELNSIISNSARGAAEGSTNVLSLNNVDKSQGTTEDVVVQVARASAHGSALASAFGMVVLDDARPDTLSYDSKSIASIESASYGSAYGAITGAITSGVPDTVIIKQAATQGSTEGALIGSGLGTTETVEDFNEEGRSYKDVELASKKNIIQAVAESSSDASSSAGETRAKKQSDQIPKT